MANETIETKCSKLQNGKVALLKIPKARCGINAKNFACKGKYTDIYETVVCGHNSFGPCKKYRELLETAGHLTIPIEREYSGVTNYQENTR